MSDTKKELLIHMLGTGEHIPKNQRGFRNHFCADVNSSDYDSLVAMVGEGLVIAGAPRDGQIFFRATVKGCEFAGLSTKEIDRVFQI